MNLRAMIAEAIGTFTLVFIGVGAIANDASLLGVAFAHGLAIAVMVAATAAISGGHLNPAVTVGLLVTGRIGVGDAVSYVVSQLVGATVAAGLLLLTLKDQVLPIAVGTPTPGPELVAAQVFVIEAVLTFLLMFVIFGTAAVRAEPAVGGLFIGLTVTLDILMGGPLTGAAMNPARHFGPALFAGPEYLAQSWIYWLAPFAGSVAASLLYHHLLHRPEPTSR
ncbi:MAG TPA: aquaporin [Trueperaceae bacterium]